MAELDTIDVELKYLKTVKFIFARYLPYKQIWAYGSRVKWTATHTSDLDCVVFGATDSEIADAKEVFDESDIPFEVQLLNWQTIPDDFKENIREQYFVLRNKWDWKETTLGEVCNRIGDGLHRTPQYTIDGKHYFINGNNLKKGQIVIKKDTKRINYKEFQKHKKDLGLNTILLSINGTIGNLAKYKNELCILGKSAGYLNIKDGVSKNFIYYLMLDSKFQNDISYNANGSTIKNVSLAQLKSYPIPLPPLPEQKAIASVLSSLDDKIDLLHRQNQTLESIAETLFRQWFVEEAQDDWEEGKLGDCIVPKKGKNITKSQAIDGQYPVIAGGLNPSCYHNRCNTSVPVITISASGANAGFVNLYYIPVWSSDSSFVDSTITTNVYFFYMFLKYFQESIYDKQEGSAQPHIYPSHLMNLDILKYPLVLIENYEINIAPFFDKIAKNQKQIKTLESLRAILLPKLMSGDVRVESEAAA